MDAPSVHEMTIDPGEEFGADRENLHAKKRQREEKEPPITIDTTLEDMRNAIREEF